MLPEQVTLLAAMSVGAGVPIAGIMVYWMMKSVYSTETERPDADAMPTHGHDRRL